MAAIGNVKNSAVSFSHGCNPVVERVTRQRAIIDSLLPLLPASVGTIVSEYAYDPYFPDLCREEGSKQVLHLIQPEDFMSETVIVQGDLAIRRIRCPKTKVSCIVAHNLETESEVWLKSAPNAKFRNSDAGIVLISNNNIDLKILNHQTGALKETVRLNPPVREAGDVYVTGDLTCYYITQDGVLVIGTINKNTFTATAKKRIGYYQSNLLQDFGNHFILREAKGDRRTLFNPDGTSYKIDLYDDLKLFKGRVYTVKKEVGALTFNNFSIGAFTAAKGKLVQPGVTVREEKMWWGIVSIVAVSDDGQSLYFSSIGANQCSYFLVDLQSGELTSIPGTNLGLVESRGKALLVSKDEKAKLIAQVWQKHHSENVGSILQHSRPFCLDSKGGVQIQVLDYSQKSK